MPKRLRTTIHLDGRLIFNKLLEPHQYVDFSYGQDTVRVLAGEKQRYTSYGTNVSFAFTGDLEANAFSDLDFNPLSMIRSLF